MTIISFLFAFITRLFEKKKETGRWKTKQERNPMNKKKKETTRKKEETEEEKGKDRDTPDTQYTIRK